MSARKIPDEVIEALRALENAEGELPPEETVVAVASDPSSAMHSLFEWSDTSAGRLYRLGQARDLIKAVRVTVLIGETKRVTPVYVQQPDRPSFVRLDKIPIKSETAMQLIATEFDRMAGSIKRAKNLAEEVQLDDLIDPEFFRIFEEMRKVFRK